MTHPRIAIVDDDCLELNALAALLEAHLFNVKGYDSALGFLSGLADGWPDCLLVDLQMP